MKLKRMTALVLCFALLLSLTGCKKEATPVNTQAPVYTAPAVTEAPELSAQELYANARAAVDSASDLSVRVAVETVTEAGNATFTESSHQVLRCTGRGTENAKLMRSEALTYGDEYYYTTYQDVYADGMAYTLVNGEYRFACEADAASCEAAMVPAVLLDAAMYGSMEKEKTSGATTITFTQPTAAESWAMPEGAEFVEASGTAVVNADGSLYKTTYAITYTYGAARVTEQYTALPELEAAEILIPQDAGKYVVMDDTQAVRMVERAIGSLAQSPYMSTSATETMTSLAAGLTRTETTNVKMYLDEDFVAEVDTNVSVVNASTSETDTSSQEERYLGGYSIRENGGSWENDAGVDVSAMYEYSTETILNGMVAMDYWKNAEIKDLGDVYLVNLTCTNQLAADLRSDVCTTLLGDAKGLDAYSTETALTGAGGYFAVDKYTGLPTASGYSYAGTDVIDQQTYVIGISNIQSYVVPDDGAYYAMTGEVADVEEPEERATPLLYHVTGADGQELYLMGTIHVGDARTSYLPQEVYDALADSAALAVEFDLIDFENKVQTNAEMQAAVAASYYYTDGTTVLDHADAELLTEAEEYMKATGNYNANLALMKPGLWAQSLENFYLRQGYSLTGQQGADRQLILWAYENNKMVFDIESGVEQMQMLGGFSDELQELLLWQAISYEPGEYWKDVAELYELWCGGNENELRQLLNDTSDQADMTAEEKKLYEEYQTAMITDRNETMLEEAIGYLESDYTIFFAVGLAHLLQDNGLVDALENAGYTVKQVGYMP